MFLYKDNRPVACEKDKTIELRSEDVFSLLPDSYKFKIHINLAKSSLAQAISSPEKNQEKIENIVFEKHEVFPENTSNQLRNEAKRKRTLPTWLFGNQNHTNEPPGKISPAIITKENPTTAIKVSPIKRSSTPPSNTTPGKRNKLQPYDGTPETSPSNSTPRRSNDSGSENNDIAKNMSPISEKFSPVENGTNDEVKKAINTQKPTATSTSIREACIYGENCYR